MMDRAKELRVYRVIVLLDLLPRERALLGREHSRIVVPQSDVGLLASEARDRTLRGMHAERRTGRIIGVYRDLEMERASAAIARGAIEVARFGRWVGRYRS